MDIRKGRTYLLFLQNKPWHLVCAPRTLAETKVAVESPLIWLGTSGNRPVWSSATVTPSSTLAIVTVSAGLATAAAPFARRDLHHHALARADFLRAQVALVEGGGQRIGQLVAIDLPVIGSLIHVLETPQGLRRL